MASAIRQLDKLTEAVTQTKREAAILREGHAATGRELRAAEEARDAHIAAVARGEKPEDEAELDRLIAAVARIRGRLNDKVKGRIVDIGVAAREASTAKVLEIQQERRATWLRENRAAVIAEYVEIAKAERSRLRAAIGELRESVKSWESVARRWDEIAGPLEVDPVDMPQKPLASTLQQLQMDLAGVADHDLAPAPWWCLDDIPDDAPAGAYGKRWINDVAEARDNAQNPQAARERRERQRLRDLDSIHAR
jgi:hypothetical protein